MTKIKKDLIERLKDLPTTFLGAFILIFGLVLVITGTITMAEFSAFAAMATPWFFAKNSKNESDKNE